MKIGELIAERDLNKSVLIGYYGGGNYGDELLMEVLSNLLHRQGVRDLSISYQTPDTFDTFHHDLGYRLLPSSDKKGLLKAIFKNKNILIGGGGLWGLDVNANIFIMSSLLFVARRVFGKKVYLLGVGYYQSTTRLGHISAWLAAKAATAIVARDPETLHNFGAHNKHVSMDRDIAWYLKSLDLSAYRPDAAKLDRRVVVEDNTLFITLRRFKKQYQNDYTSAIAECLERNQDKHIIVALMEPKAVDPDGWRLLESWRQKYPDIQTLDFSFNPVGLYLFFQNHHKQLRLVAPQFHALITAHLNNVPFLPLVYDNKAQEMLRLIGYNTTVHIRDITAGKIQDFIDA